MLEGSKDGALYVNILLKLYLKSLQHNGKLLLNEMTPLAAEMIALFTRHEVGTVERAMRAFMQLGLVEVLDDNIFYMPEIQEMIGKGSSEGERKARYRRQKAEENMLLLTDMGQNRDNVPPVSEFCPPEIRDKNLDKRESEREKSAPTPAGGEKKGVPMADMGMKADDDYKDTETGLLMCGKCHTRKQKKISFFVEERIVCCLCRCAAEELEKAEKERKDRETMEGISRE